MMMMMMMIMTLMMVAAKRKSGGVIQLMGISLWMPMEEYNGQWQYCMTVMVDGDDCGLIQPMVLHGV